MFHKHRAAIGRESSRPASRGILAYPKPRRRNCLRSISLAARTRVGNSAFCTLLGATKSVWPAGDQAGWCCRLIGRHACARVCGAITFRTITHRCRAAVPFGQSSKRHQKRFLPRRQAGDAVTGGDVSRIARNSHRKRRTALSVFDGAESVERKFFSPHTHGIRPSAVPGKFRQSRNVAPSKGRFLR